MSDATGAATAEEMALLLAARRPAPVGSLRAWDIWLGARPGDHDSRLLHAHADGDTLALQLDGGDMLWVRAPERLSFSGRGVAIRDAASVRYEWTHRGLPHETLPRHHVELRAHAHGVDVDSDVAWALAHVPVRSADALELR